VRLVPKVFLWFWIGIVLVSATAVGLTEFTHSRAKDDEHWRERYGPRVDLWARQETQILDRRGTDALRKYVAGFETDPGVKNFIFDSSGNEVLDQQAPANVLWVVSSMQDASSSEQQLLATERIAAQKIVRPNGPSHIVVVAFPQPSLLSSPLVDFLTEDLGQAQIVRFLAVLGVAGVLCFWLARQITNPIEKLRAATREIAEARLGARVDRKITSGHDELAELGRDFDWMAERIDTLVSAERRLLSDVSHTLRSPLARLSVALGLARQHANPEATAHLDRIERETDRLNRVIGQLLTVARVESGVGRERPTRFDLGQLVEEVAADGDYEARSHHALVEFSHPPVCLVNGVRELLRTAVENVVRNAVRHAPDGTKVEIALELRGTRAIVSVRDHGMGVPESALGSLFEPFFQVAGGSQPQGDSTGLGLTITERTLRLHGGSVSAANAPGGGLVVALDLPLAGDEAPAPAASAASPGLAAWPTPATRQV
jgi:signal transduction histidine kinase